MEQFKPSETAFPYGHLCVLATVLLASSVSQTGLFPYVGFMVVKFKMADSIDSAGFTAGFVAAAMNVGRLMSSVFWGRLADRIGRKPVLFIGCTSVATFSLLFGLSTNFYMALTCRFFLGLFNPIVTISKTLVSEICAKKYESTGMGIVMGCWSLGYIIGPAFGGLLADPAASYPTVCGGNRFLEKFPYFAPNVVTASFAIFGLIMMKFSNFPETLKIQAAPETPESGIGSSQNSSSGRNSVNFSQLLAREGVAANLSCWFVLSLIQIMNDEVFSLWAMSSRTKGGLLLSSAHIGNIMTLMGTVLVIYTFLLYPVIANAFGPRLSFLIGQSMMVPVCLTIQLSNRIRLREAYLIAIVAAWATMGRMGCNLATSSVSLLINQSVESNMRATINGISTTIGSTARAIGPVLGSVIFAWSINNSRHFPLDYHFAYICVASLAATNCLIIMHFVRRRSDGQAIASASPVESDIMESGEKKRIKLEDGSGDDRDAAIQLITRNVATQAVTVESDSDDGDAGSKGNTGSRNALNDTPEKASAKAAPILPLHSPSNVSLGPIAAKAYAMFSGNFTLAKKGRGSSAYTAVATQEEEDHDRDKEQQDDGQTTTNG